MGVADLPWGSGLETDVGDHGRRSDEPRKGRAIQVNTRTLCVTVWIDVETGEVLMAEA